MLFTLKDGREADIEIWGYRELREYVDSSRTRKKEGKEYRPVRGFSFLSQEGVNNLLYRGDPIYNGRNLSPMERQEISGLPKEHYVKSIASLHDEELIGLIVLNWARDNVHPREDFSAKDKLPFWRYFAEFIDVREEFQNKGVATGLTRAMDSSGFLKNKILQLSIYNEMGKLYAFPLNEKELSAENYALIPHDYSITTPPEKPGIYDKFGKPMKKTGRI